MKSHEDTKERFKNSFIIDLKTGCWVWQKHKQNGYGYININKVNWRAHRYSYLINKGSLPINKWILHTCDNRACVNPDHLYAGTAKENYQDMVNRHPERIFYCGKYQKGEAHSRTKLKEKDVIEILNSKLEAKELVSLYGICLGHLYRIKKRKYWKLINKE